MCAAEAVRPLTLLDALSHIKILHLLPIMQFRFYPQHPTSRHVFQHFPVCVDVPLSPLSRLKNLSMEESGHCKVSSIAPRDVQTFGVGAVPV